MAGTSREPVVDMLDEVWTSLAGACDDLAPADWELPTDCPGWTVRDQLSHVIGIERALMGEGPPPGDGVDAPHVKNEMGAHNEVWVDARRDLPGTAVLDELREVTSRRLQELRSMSEAEFDAIGWSPVGQVPYREFMRVRVFDSWVHEQDVRKAVGRPGGLGGAGEAVTLDRMVAAMGFVVGRKVAPPEGTAVVWQMTGRVPREVAIVMEGGRGTTPSSPPAEPAVRFDLDTDTFWRLACGRISAVDALGDGVATMSGDAVLGRRILEAMAITP